MSKRGPALLLLALTALGCDHDKPAAPTPAAASSFAALPAPGGIVPGSRVLAPFGATFFVEAEVVRVSGTRVTTKKGKSYDADDLVLLPPGGETSGLRQGEPVLARVSRGLWTVTTIEKIDGDRFVVDTEKHHRLVRSDLLTPPKSVTRAMNTRLGADALRRKAQARVPYRPQGYAPKLGDAVLYRTQLDGGRWFSGKILEAAGGAYRIQSNIHRIDTWFGPERIGPPPSAKAPPPNVGDFVLLEPEMRNWTFAKVERVDERFAYVRTEDGDEERAALEDVLRLVPHADVWLPPFQPKTAKTLLRSVLFEDFLREIGATGHETKGDGTLEIKNQDKRLLTAKYELVLHYGPLSGYTMAWEIPEAALRRPIVPKQDAPGPGKVADAVEHEAFRRAVAAADARHAPFVYVTSKWYVTLDDVRLALPRAELASRDLSRQARALLDSFPEPTVSASAP